MNRREFLRTAGGATAAGAGVAVAGPAAAQEEDGDGDGQQGPIDYGGWFSDVPYWGGDGSTVDATGQEEVTIDVGAGSNGLAFGPAAVHVDPGTTVVWEWTGRGNAHNVVADSVPSGIEAFDSGTPMTSGSYEVELPGDANGIATYYCNPHLGQGMLGGLAVGEVPREAVNQQTPPPVVSESARTLGVAATIAMASTLGLAYFFVKYSGDYTEE
jgi:halocyanin-like protein